MSQRDPTQPAAETPQKLPTACDRLRCENGTHGFTADEVWSWTIRQPADVLLKINVNKPDGASASRFRFQRPKTSAVSAPNGVMSISEKLNTPIAARVGYFL